MLAPSATLTLGTEERLWRLMMLMRTDPFRELDRLAQQVWGTPARPAVMPMDAWREGDKFVVEFDLPGVRADSLNLDVERNTLTVRAECPVRDPKLRRSPRVRSRSSVKGVIN